MPLNQISDSDLIDLHRLSREMLTAMHRAKMQDTILADLLDEFEQQTTMICRTRFAPPQPSQNAAAF